MDARVLPRGGLLRRGGGRLRAGSARQGADAASRLRAQKPLDDRDRGGASGDRELPAARGARLRDHELGGPGAWRPQRGGHLPDPGRRTAAPARDPPAPSRRVEGGQNRAPPGARGLVRFSPRAPLSIGGLRRAGGLSDRRRRARDAHLHDRRSPVRARGRFSAGGLGRRPRRQRSRAHDRRQRAHLGRPAVRPLRVPERVSQGSRRSRASRLDAAHGRRGGRCEPGGVRALARVRLP